MNIGDKAPEIYSAAQLTEFIHEVGFLPLLDSGIPGFAAEDIVTDDCRYVASWTSGDYVFSVKSSSGLPRESFLTLIREIN